MEKYKTIHEEIESATNRDVAKQVNISLVAVAVIVAGVLFGLWGMTFEDPNSSMPTFLFTASTLFGLGGVVKLLTSRNGYVYRPTKSRLKPLTVYYDVHASDELQNALQMKRPELLGQLRRVKDNGVKVQALVSSDNRFAAVQVLEYVPYAFEAVTPVMYFKEEEARRLSAVLKG